MPAGNETYDVFVSYSRADSLHAKDIDSALRANGLKSFFDRRNLDPGLPWVRALEKAIGAARSANGSSLGACESRCGRSRRCCWPG